MTTTLLPGLVTAVCTMSAPSSGGAEAPRNATAGRRRPRPTLLARRCRKRRRSRLSPRRSRALEEAAFRAARSRPGKNDSLRAVSSGSPARPGAAVGALPRLVSVAVGESHVCVLGLGGQVWCWTWNQPGNPGTGRGKPGPGSRVGGLPAAVQISAGSRHTCALDASGRVRCWRHLSRADGRRGRLAEPKLVSRLPRVRLVRASGDHTCALDVRGRVWCWGADRWGQASGRRTCPGKARGSSPRNRRVHRPVRLRGLPSSLRAIAVGPDHGLALARDGSVWCWGRCLLARTCANGPARRVARFRPSSSSRVHALIAGLRFSCALAGSWLTCWDLAPGLRLQARPLPEGWEALPEPTRFLQTGAAVAGPQSLCALFGRELRCWGDNRHHQLDPDPSAPRVIYRPRPWPGRKQGLSLGTKPAMAVGSKLSCALLLGRMNRIACWGDGLPQAWTRDRAGLVWLRVSAQGSP